MEPVDPVDPVEVDQSATPSKSVSHHLQHLMQVEAIPLEKKQLRKSRKEVHERKKPQVTQPGRNQEEDANSKQTQK